MSPDREANIRDFFLAMLALLTVPRPASPADDDLYLIELDRADAAARGALRHLINGPLDNLAIQEEARVLMSLDRPVAYPAERRLAS